MTEGRVVVRCVDRMTFEVHPETYEPKQTAIYDAHCFSDPESGARYISHAEWLMLRNKQMREASNDRA